MSKPTTKIRPFAGVSWVPDEVKKWLGEVGKKECSAIHSGQWMVKRAWEGGPVQIWLHLADAYPEDADE